MGKLLCWLGLHRFGPRRRVVTHTIDDRREIAELRQMCARRGCFARRTLLDIDP